MLFLDRIDAGNRLAQKLRIYKNQNAVVYAIPKGGVVVGAQISKDLNIPLDLLFVKKIGHPQRPEYAVAAISEDGHEVIDPDNTSIILSNWYANKAYTIRQQLQQERFTFLGFNDPIDVQNKVAILTDDGIATGLTIKAALFELQHRHPKKIILAIPIASGNVIQELSREVDEIIVLNKPDQLDRSVSEYYKNFPDVLSQEVKQIMNRNKQMNYHHNLLNV